MASIFWLWRKASSARSRSSIWICNWRLASDSSSARASSSILARRSVAWAWPSTTTNRKAMATSRVTPVWRTRVAYMGSALVRR